MQSLDVFAGGSGDDHDGDDYSPPPKDDKGKGSDKGDKNDRKGVINRVNRAYCGVAANMALTLVSLALENDRRMCKWMIMVATKKGKLADLRDRTIAGE